MNLAFWRRDWELISSQEFPSQAERLDELGYSIKSVRAPTEGELRSMISRTLVQTFKCKRTGKVKTIRTYI